MKLKSTLKNLLFFFLLLSFATANNSCTKEEEDACLKSETSNKIVNMRVYLHIETIDGEPIADEEVTLTVSMFPCGNDIAIPEEAIASYDFNGITDVNGIRESDVANFVLTNTQDRIVVYGVAPYLDYYQQNYHRKILYYSEIQGTSLDEIHLYIYQQQQQ